MSPPKPTRQAKSSGKKKSSSVKPASQKPRRIATPRKPAVRRKVYSEKHISFFVIFICLLQTCFLGGLLFVLISLKIPAISNVANYTPSQATIIYDRFGKIVDRMYTENRTVIPLSEMSPLLPKAFVSAEDGRFFEHLGLDLVSVLRAAINNIRTGARSQGGSTITQQVAKSLLLTPEKTYIRKFKEAILAWRIDKLLTKEEILFIYLNQIYLGEGAHGVEAAAQVYFGKSAKQLSLGEITLLAGLPQAPSRYSLFNHLDRAVKRQKYVLNRMAAEGYITPTSAQKAYREKINLSRKKQRSNDSTGFYLQMVKKEARSILQMPLQTAGARIYTYMDASMNKAALVALRRGVGESVKRRKRAGKKNPIQPQGALVCVESSNGKVRALVGGTSFAKSPFDRASQAKRPAGSTFKPFVYAAAVENGWRVDSAVLDEPLSIRGKDGRMWSPQNYSGRYHGQTTLKYSLAHSLNSASVRVMQKVGYKKVHEIAKASGITAQLPPDLSLALGATDVSLLEMTAAYTVFAGDGTFQKPQIIERIVLPNGTVVYPHKTGGKEKVLGGRSIKAMRAMLGEVVRSGTGKKVANVGSVKGGKTGTSDDNRDAWFIGYDNKYTTGVWVGNDRNEPLGKSESGGTTAAPIWKKFMLSLR